MGMEHSKGSNTSPITRPTTRGSLLPPGIINQEKGHSFPQNNNTTLLCYETSYEVVSIYTRVNTFWSHAFSLSKLSKDLRPTHTTQKKVSFLGTRKFSRALVFLFPCRGPVIWESSVSVYHGSFFTVSLFSFSL